MPDPQTKILHPEFVAWCAKLSLETGPCYRQFASYSVGLGFLTMTRDTRTIPVMRDALAARSNGVVAIAARGLGLLDDAPSIPLVAWACERFPRAEAYAIGVASETFDDPAVELIFTNCIADGNLQNDVRKERNARLAAGNGTGKEP